MFNAKRAYLFGSDAKEGQVMSIIAWIVVGLIAAPSPRC
jgi:hypothetical protein